jgi:CHAD domain-containing protein
LQDSGDIQITEPQAPSSRVKGDPGIYAFGASILSRGTRNLQAEIGGVRSAEDIESIHRMRVASRRLRSALGVFKDILPEKKQAEWIASVRHMTRALGEARDTDVQIELLEDLMKDTGDKKIIPGMNRLLLRLQQHRQRVQKDVIRALDELEQSKTCPQILARFESTPEESIPFSPALYQLAYNFINEKLNLFLSYEVYLRQPDNATMLHAMRIAAKRLRYAMEIFAPVYTDQLSRPLQAARKSQQVLGDVHDCDVWIVFLPGFEEKERTRIQRFYGNQRPIYRLTPGIQFFLHNRQDVRKTAYLDFLKMWRKWREAEVWLSLRETILMAVPVEKPSTDTQPVAAQPPQEPPG